MTNLISIVVPVYNTKKYLNECVNSLLNQTHENIEIILINDGSTDGSDKICDYYANKDKRIKVIHQSNGGLSLARNVGIDLSTGEYIMFVDSDDSITHDACDCLLTAALKFNVNVVHGDLIKSKSQNRIYENKVMNNREYIMESIKTWTYDVIVVLNLVKLDLIRSNRLKFEPGLCYEDQLYSYQLYLLNNARIVSIPKLFYNYRVNDSGISRTHNIKKSQDIFNIICLMIKEHNSIRSDFKYSSAPILIAYSHFIKIVSFLTVKERDVIVKSIDPEVKKFTNKHRLYNLIGAKIMLFNFFPNTFLTLLSLRNKFRLGV